MKISKISCFAVVISLFFLFFSEIHAEAKKMGLQVAQNVKKSELIQAIQKDEGYSPCYGTNDGSCPYQNCLWINDCKL